MTSVIRRPTRLRSDFPEPLLSLEVVRSLSDMEAPFEENTKKE
jgi:hypothetical protein